MKLIAGLGNPGFKYRNTRHNIGFSIVNTLAKKYNIKINKKKFKALAGEGVIEGNDVMLLLPQTFMNLSGVSVGLAVSKVSSLSDLLVISDDVDLELGNIRIKARGSSGGHKGLTSIIDQLKTEEFHRLRIGIRPKDKIENTQDFVLKPFLKKEKNTLDSILDEAVNCIEIWLSEGIEVCMRRYNRKNTV